MIDSIGWFDQFRQVGQFETGLKLLKINSNLGFFKSGWSRASFRLIKKIPLCREVFTIFVMVGATASVICLSNVVGIGSISQHFTGAYLIAALTSSSVTVLKVSNCLPVSKFFPMYFESVWSKWVGIRFTIILSIFSVKKSMKPSAESWTLAVGVVVSCHFWK